MSESRPPAPRLKNCKGMLSQRAKISKPVARRHLPTIRAAPCFYVLLSPAHMLAQPSTGGWRETTAVSQLRARANHHAMVLVPPRAVVEAAGPACFHVGPAPAHSRVQRRHRLKTVSLSSSFRSASSSPFRVVMGMDRIERRMI